MKQNIEEAKRRVFFYYHDFINKCLEDHGIDLTTIINDCVTAGYESRSGEKVMSNDWWHQGDVPECFRDIMPDNAKWNNSKQ